MKPLPGGPDLPPPTAAPICSPGHSSPAQRRSSGRHAQQSVAIQCSTPQSSPLSEATADMLLPPPNMDLSDVEANMQQLWEELQSSVPAAADTQQSAVSLPSFPDELPDNFSNMSNELSSFAVPHDDTCSSAWDSFQSLVPDQDQSISSAAATSPAFRGAPSSLFANIGALLANLASATLTPSTIARSTTSAVPPAIPMGGPSTTLQYLPAGSGPTAGARASEPSTLETCPTLATPTTAARATALTAPEFSPATTGQRPGAAGPTPMETKLADYKTSLPPSQRQKFEAECEKIAQQRQELLQMELGFLRSWGVVLPATKAGGHDVPSLVSKDTERKLRGEAEAQIESYESVSTTVAVELNSFVRWGKDEIVFNREAKRTIRFRISTQGPGCDPWPALEAKISIYDCTGQRLFLDFADVIAPHHACKDGCVEMTLPGPSTKSQQTDPCLPAKNGTICVQLLHKATRKELIDNSHHSPLLVLHRSAAIARKPPSSDDNVNSSSNSQPSFNAGPSLNSEEKSTRLTTISMKKGPWPLSAGQ